MTCRTKYAMNTSMKTNLPQHEYDLITHFCIHCGKGKYIVDETRVNCYRANNVIPISHIRAQQILRDLVNDL